MSMNRSAIHKRVGRKRCGLCTSFLPAIICTYGRLILTGMLLACSSASFGAMVLSDTITVDGIPLQLELDIMEVSPPRPPANKGKGKTIRGRNMPDVVVGVGWGAMMRPTSAQGPTLDAFLQRGLRPVSGANLTLEWRQERMFLRVNVAGDVMKEWAFDARFLEDSLYEVEPDGSGGLEQRIFRTYDLGIEIDTLSLPTSAHRVTSGVVGISLGGIRSGPRSGQELFRWWAGFHWRAARGSRTPSQINRMIPDGLPSPAGVEGEQRNDWEPNQSSGWGVQAGLSKNWANGPLYLRLIGQWTAGDQGRWSCMAGLGWRLRSRD